MPLNDVTLLDEVVMVMYGQMRAYNGLQDWVEAIEEGLKLTFIKFCQATSHNNGTQANGVPLEIEDDINLISATSWPNDGGAHREWSHSYPWLPKLPMGKMSWVSCILTGGNRGEGGNQIYAWSG